MAADDPTTKGKVFDDNGSALPLLRFAGSVFYISIDDTLGVCGYGNKIASLVAVTLDCRNSGGRKAVTAACYVP